MKINGKHYRTIWFDDTEEAVFHIIDQTKLPFEFCIQDVSTSDEAVRAIKNMTVRGAPLIGATAIFGLYLAVNESYSFKNPSGYLQKQAQKLIQARPTAVDLEKSVRLFLSRIGDIKNQDSLKHSARQFALQYAEQSVEQCLKIGQNGLPLIKNIFEKKKKEVNILTHCNAGWLATVDYGTALAPIYLAHQEGVPLHIWVDETRPRNQGSLLTAFELSHENIPHTIISDNTGGYLMQNGMVDMVIVGTDRTKLSGKVANKIGTYLKALAAYDNQIPFYVAAPSTSIDFENEDFIIEKRSAEEVRKIKGKYGNKIINVLISNESSPALNYAFDITPARYVTQLITERGCCLPEREEILKLFPEKSHGF